MKPEMRGNGWRTWTNAFIDPIGFILTHWLALMVWPNGVLALVRSIVLIIALTSIKPPSRWCGSTQATSVVQLKVAWLPLHVQESRGSLLWFAWPADWRLARGQAFNEWTVGRCETSFRNCQEPVSKLKMMPLMPNKIHGLGAVKLKNSDMISGPELIWHGRLDVLMTARLTWRKACQALSCPCSSFWHWSLIC